MRFRKKPVVIEADQWYPFKEVTGVCTCEAAECGRSPHVHTAHDGQAVLLSPGDWIIPERDGKGFYPCKPDVFAATYEPLEIRVSPDGGACASVFAFAILFSVYLLVRWILPAL